MTTSAIATPAFVTSADGTRIGYLQEGSGPAVVLVQGAMADVHAYRRLSTALADSCTVIRAERRGRGLSPKPFDHTHRIERDVEDLDAVLAATGARAVFGLSSGAVITLASARLSDKVERAIAFEPPYYADGMDRRAVDRLFADLERDDLPSALLDAQVAAGTAPPVLRRMPRPLARALARAVLAVQARGRGPASALRDLLPGVRYDFTDVASVDGRMADCADISVPTLLLSGTRSPTFLQDAVRRLLAVIPDAHHRALGGLGHDGPWNGGGPERVADAVRPFLLSAER